MQTPQHNITTSKPDHNHLWELITTPHCLSLHESWKRSERGRKRGGVRTNKEMGERDGWMDGGKAWKEGRHTCMISPPPVGGGDYRFAP